MSINGGVELWGWTVHYESGAVVSHTGRLEVSNACWDHSQHEAVPRHASHPVAGR